MPSPSSGPVAFTWRKWKSLKLPWRRRWLAGVDLAGNSYYYFQPSGSASPRRLLQSNKKVGYSDVQISPQWHQWLRYTRPSPPSIQEQQQDLIRQQQLKVLAQEAEERWARKERIAEAPRRPNLALGVGDGEKEGTLGQTKSAGGQHSVNTENAVKMGQNQIPVPGLPREEVEGVEVKMAPGPEGEAIENRQVDRETQTKEGYKFPWQKHRLSDWERGISGDPKPWWWPKNWWHRG